MIDLMPLSKAAQIADVALKTSITTTISYSPLKYSYSPGVKQTSICFLFSMLFN